MRFFGEILTEISRIFRGHNILGLRLRRHPLFFRVLQPAHEPQRSPVTVQSVGMPWHVRFGAILGEVLTEIFEFFSRPRNFAIEIARDRAEIRCPPCAAAGLRASQVPRHCAERRHAEAREIRCDSRRNSDRNFRNFFAAAKFYEITIENARDRAEIRCAPRAAATP